MPRETTPRVPDLLLERLHAGDLPPAEAEAVRARLAEEPDGEARLAALRADDAATLLLHPPARVAEEVRRRAPRARRSPVAWRVLPALAAAAAVLVAMPLLRTDDPEGERVKGLRPALVLHRRTANGAEVLRAGATGRGGDLVQVGYVASGARFGVIVSLDGAGAVTRHWPLDGEEAAPLTSGREVLLPESFRLDDAPGYERFLLVASDRPFAVATVLAAARGLAARPDAATAPLSLAPALSQASALVLKESR